MIVIPIDVIRYILQYIDDPDIRRFFGVFNKINLLKYKKIDFITRNNCTTLDDNRSYINNMYNLKNLYNLPRVKLLYMENDNIVTNILIKKKFVHYDITIKRLKLITDISDDFDKYQIYLQNFKKYNDPNTIDLLNYYWEVIHYNYFLY